MLSVALLLGALRVPIGAEAALFGFVADLPVDLLPAAADMVPPGSELPALLVPVPGGLLLGPPLPPPPPLP